MKLSYANVFLCSMARSLKKSLYCILLVISGVSYSKADPYIYLPEDSLVHFLKIQNRDLQDKKLVNYIKLRFQQGP
ncbi:hypothetical protein DIU38_004815 [Mucilaginibacter sp. P4]|nr:hypothetical protein [Mucilaginibacter gossypii]QEM15477.1 hypothetical protein DIU38_004815 [Mucilaginibacter gossypii]